MRFADLGARRSRRTRCISMATTCRWSAARDGFFVRVEESARAGSRYAYSFDGRDLRVPDPASRFNPDDVHAPSEVVDPSAFDWTDEQWHGRPWREAVIYELHVGTFTPEGTYAARGLALDYLAELGVTAIELMPLADTPGTRNWGYDGVLPFAPEHGYGRPEELKRFVEAAHARGLMVLLDVVYNHFGPEGNYLAPLRAAVLHRAPPHAVGRRGSTSTATRARTCASSSSTTRSTGSRNTTSTGCGSTPCTRSSTTPTRLPRRARSGRPGSHDSVVRCISCSRTTTTPRATCAATRGEPPAYDAQWNDDFHHALHALLARETGGYYETTNAQRPTYCARCSRGSRTRASIRATRGAPRGEPSAKLPPDSVRELPAESRSDRQSRRTASGSGC